MSRLSISLVAFTAAIALALAHPAHANTYTVTSLADSGAGSLRDAIEQANAHAGDDTINFALAAPATITLTSGTIFVTEALTISGPGAANLTIDGNANNRIFTIYESGVTPPCPELTGPSDYLVTISGMTLQNGRRNVVNSSGGAVLSFKSLMLDQVVVKNSSAKNGGGVSFLVQYPGQALTVTGSSFIDNGAQANASGNTGTYNGGALFAVDNCTGSQIGGTVSISDSAFVDNYVAPDVLNGSGGAISVYDQLHLTVTRSRITGNHIDRPNPPGTFSYTGGGINAQWLTLTDSEVAGNFAHYGGGVIIALNDPTLQSEGDRRTSQIINSTIWDNTATQDGGGVYVYGNVEVDIVNSTIADNTALVGAGGGVLTGRSAGAYLDPKLVLQSSILSGAQLNGKTDLYNYNGNTPAINVASDHSAIFSPCNNCGITLVGANNVVGTDPLLGPPSLNGGPVIGGSAMHTMPLLAGSPAKDMGSNPLAIANDQRGAGYPRLVGSGVDMGAMEGVGTCSNMSDVPSSSTFCANVDFLRNRGVTLGCTGTTYCPNDPVTRAQMAIFMNRLGTALSPTVLSDVRDLGATVVPEVGNVVMLCQTDFVAPVPYRRAALVSARVNGLADAGVSWRTTLFYSVDGGVNWLQPSTNVGMRDYADAGEWSNGSTASIFQLARDLEYTFAVGILRDDNITGLTGNFSEAHCDLIARVVNRNGSTAPF